MTISELCNDVAYKLKYTVIFKCSICSYSHTHFFLTLVTDLTAITKSWSKTWLHCEVIWKVLNRRLTLERAHQPQT